MVDMPYFMTNDEWFYYDYKTKKYKLTEKAPYKVKKSYEDFYSNIYGGKNEHNKN